ncbi:sugar nucleotide-binding protein [Mobilicoccus pelagius]|uniref:dTDP-4-dehydrorhamnose reductase n=1 Tax=Mobilicoccus pelagius NBRC 104925 TaxID=1089455 RepID=H5USD8_9MICO|nr:bifunctional dTDP-4-dehydrorhamnose 3,5-epimerase family protein/NAD(P)-dependent oxidoreductase [Mobilicoccus pelagius]GAB48646.1 dTDP-6-deoxy-D-xylo-4-hexulose 3,5-epimerase/dTDP-6-deoxy-L-lyxo-4-hexulose reductase [Mobilicoccus pelagius NBRC 104925]
MTDLAVHTTDIPGLLVVDLPVHGDNRGWFKENWQRAKMTGLGLPDFGPVQQNVSFNDEVGVTRGVHAEPWDKFVSVATGRVFGAWVDLRAGDTFGAVVTCEITPERAVFVPRGVGNAYQTLEPATAYSYLVNDHWSPAAKERYTFVQLGDPELAIPWPIPLEKAILSDADKAHPALADATPFTPGRAVVLGASGQLGRALRGALPDAVFLTRAEADLTEPASLSGIDLDGIDTIVNAAAYTAVDAAETPEGRREAWAANVAGVGALVDLARRHSCRLVHVSSDYVFDGTAEEHDEDEPFSPLGVYGQTKAAGDALVASWGKHYIVRTSWVVGEGRNFVATMAALADKGVSPSVVDDQYGRLTFTQDLAAGIAHLLAAGAEYGTYNLTNSGPVQTWADIAADVYELRGRSRDDVTRVSTEEYGAGKDMAPRPTHSALDLAKITAAGFDVPHASERLRRMLA